MRMTDNSVINRTHIIRSQAEYSAASQTTSYRCILETPATGQRQGFADVESLLSALRAEFIEMHNQIILSD